jgi:GNAT superfamily N-acetyltransferase
VDPGAVDAEQIEREAMRDLFAAADPALDATVREIGPAALFSVRAVPALLFNRALGLGVFRPASHADAVAVTRHFAERGVTRYLVHLHPHLEPPRVRDWLCDQGLVPYRRAWTKYARGAAPAAAAETSLRLERIDGDPGHDRAAHFARVVCDGYGLPPAAAGLLRPLAGRPRWYLYLSYAGDRVAGTAAMFIAGDLAWLGFGATEPEFRGRGSQRALLAQRIRDGLDAGVRTFHVETGETIPGEPQSAYHNFLGAGFQRLYTRDNLCPASGRASSP